MRTRLSLPARIGSRQLYAATGLLLGLAACRGDSGAVPGADSALARDLALANVLTSQAEFNDAPLREAPQPEQRDPVVPPAPVRAPRAASRPSVARPAASRPAPRTPAPAADAEDAPGIGRDSESAAGPSPAAARGFSSGTRLALSTGERVCTISGRPGDKMTATLRDPVRGTGGAMIPAGSIIVLEVASVEPGDPAEAGRITFRIRALDVDETTYPAHGSGAPAAELQRAQAPRVNASDRRSVIGGAVAGAILGQVLGGGTRGAVIGAAAGGAAGAVKAKGDQQFEGCLPAGSPVTIVLEEGLTIS